MVMSGYENKLNCPGKYCHCQRPHEQRHKGHFPLWFFFLDIFLTIFMIFLFQVNFRIKIYKSPRWDFYYHYYIGFIDALRTNWYSYNIESPTPDTCYRSVFQYLLCPSVQFDILWKIFILNIFLLNTFLGILKFLVP